MIACYVTWGEIGEMRFDLVVRARAVGHHLREHKFVVPVRDPVKDTAC